MDLQKKALVLVRADLEITWAHNVVECTVEHAVDNQAISCHIDNPRGKKQIGQWALHDVHIIQPILLPSNVEDHPSILSSEQPGKLDNFVIFPFDAGVFKVDFVTLDRQFAEIHVVRRFVADHCICGEQRLLRSIFRRKIIVLTTAI